MKLEPEDTNPEAERALIKMLRRTPTWKRAEQPAGLIRARNVFILSDLRRRYPEADADELRLPYVVAGSVASSLQGFSRTTADVDIPADFRVEHVAPLCAALKEEFYLDDQAMRRAVSPHSAFDLIHFDTAFKVDIYVARTDEITRQRLERRRRETLLPGEAGLV